MSYGILTVLPAVLVIVVAIISKRTTESLFLGCVTSYLIIAIFDGKNITSLLVDSFFSVLTDYDTIWLIIVCGLFGSLVALMNEAKGTHAIAKALGKVCKSGKSTLIASWLLGIIIFIDDYMNIMTVSACTRNLSDKRKVPRESLAYVVDSTGAPVCVLLPFSTWAIFFAGVFYEHSEVVNLGYGSAMQTYIHAIPYMFYAIAAVIIVPLFAMGIVPKIGPMKAAYDRTEKTGKVYSDKSAYLNNDDGSLEDKDSRIIDFLVPVIAMIVIQLLTDDMFVAVVAAILLAAVLYIPRKKIKASKFCNLWIKGFADSVPALAIIVAALWMRQASSDLNLPNYIIDIVKPIITPQLYPMIAFIVVAALGFITGSNWGIPAVCAPIIIPLGAACGANMLAVLAAIVCGGTFCSHACFYSDATVITSNACGIDNMDHAYTQMPYALISMAVSIIGFLVVGIAS